MDNRDRRHRPSSRARGAAVVVALVASVCSALAGTSPATAAPTTDGSFNPVSPVRLLDTRTTGGCLNGTRQLKVTGVGGVPSDSGAVILNVTAVTPWGDGFLTVFPTGTARPTASNLNYGPWSVVPNAVTVKVGTGGYVSIFASSGCPQVVVDLNGSFAAAGPAGAGGFTPVAPARLLDTRSAGQGPCINGARTLQVAGRGGVPADATAADLNVTVTEPWGAGYLTAYPTGASRPTASNLNYEQYQTVANHVSVQLGPGGTVSLFTNNGCPHVVVDVGGSYAAGSPVVAGGFTPQTPVRLLDTRLVSQGPCLTGGRTTLVAGSAAVPGDAGSVVLNVTVTGAQGGGFLTVWPAGSSRPTVSSLNYTPGQTVPNHVTTRLGAGGAVNLYASNGCPNVVVDVLGWHSAPTSLDPTYDVEVDVSQAPALTAAAKTAVATAVARWTGSGAVDGVATATNSTPVITGGVPAWTGTMADDACGEGETGFTGTVEDLRVVILAKPLDDVGGTLAYAGPCGPLPSPSFLPRYGIVVLDTNDLGSSGLTSILTHELAHVFGFGTLWDVAGRTLVTASGSAYPTYNGEVGTAAYARLGGAGAPPLESGGGDGTAEAHWLESRFRSELMTGFISLSSSNPLSLMTVAAMADLGYQVDVTHADTFSLAAAARAAGRAAAQGSVPVAFEPATPPLP